MNQVSNLAQHLSTIFIGFKKKLPSKLFLETSFTWYPCIPSGTNHQLLFFYSRLSTRNSIFWPATLSLVSTSAPSVVHLMTPFSCFNTSDSPKIARGDPGKSSTFGSQSIVCAIF